MCGRYALHSHPQVVALAFGLDGIAEFAPRYNIAPTAQVVVVRARETSREAAMVRWGLVPRWAKDASYGARMNNARAETVSVKPTFRDAWRHRRCLVPANGFYEWKLEGGRKQPYYITPSTGELFAFGGLWESWHGPAGVLETCAIVTTDANQPMSAVHDRMPVIVPASDYGRWLDFAPGNDASGLLRPAPAEAIAIRKVGRAVNNARNDAPDLIVSES